MGRQQSAYVYGNVALKPDIRRQLEEKPQKHLSNEARKNREKAHLMSLGYVLFLSAALICAGVILIDYIQLQSSITTITEQISDMELELNNLKTENNETLNRINGSIDMEEVKRIAIGQLGMTYAAEGQIESYESEEIDYLRRVSGN